MRARQRDVIRGRDPFATAFARDARPQRQLETLRMDLDGSIAPRIFGSSPDERGLAIGLMRIWQFD